jgi:predicted DNA-binding protein (UPF0278 family)
MRNDNFYKVHSRRILFVLARVGFKPESEYQQKMIAKKNERWLEIFKGTLKHYPVNKVSAFYDAVRDIRRRVEEGKRIDELVDLKRVREHLAYTMVLDDPAVEPDFTGLGDELLTCEWKWNLDETLGMLDRLADCVPLVLNTNG